MTRLTKIMLDPEVMGGTPCIRRLRITVSTIVGDNVILFPETGGTRRP